MTAYPFSMSRYLPVERKNRRTLVFFLNGHWFVLTKRNGNQHKNFSWHCPLCFICDMTGKYLAMGSKYCPATFITLINNIIAIKIDDSTVQAIRNLTLTKFVRSRSMSHEIVRHRANESEFRNEKSHRKPCNLIRMKANS